MKTLLKTLVFLGALALIRGSLQNSILQNQNFRPRPAFGFGHVPPAQTATIQNKFGPSGFNGPVQNAITQNGRFLGLLIPALAGAVAGGLFGRQQNANIQNLDGAADPQGQNAAIQNARGLIEYIKKGVQYGLPYVEDYVPQGLDMVKQWASGRQQNSILQNQFGPRPGPFNYPSGLQNAMIQNQYGLSGLAGLQSANIQNGRGFLDIIKEGLKIGIPLVEALGPVALEAAKNWASSSGRMQNAIIQNQHRGQLPLPYYGYRR